MKVTYTVDGKKFDMGNVDIERVQFSEDKRVFTVIFKGGASTSWYNAVVVEEKTP